MRNLKMMNQYGNLCLQEADIEWPYRLNMFNKPFPGFGEYCYQETQANQDRLKRRIAQVQGRSKRVWDRLMKLERKEGLHRGIDMEQKV